MQQHAINRIIRRTEMVFDAGILPGFPGGFKPLARLVRSISLGRLEVLKVVDGVFHDVLAA